MTGRILKDGDEWNLSLRTRQQVDALIRGYENVMYDYRNEGLNDVVININDSKTMVQWLEQFEPADEVNRQKFVVNIESSIDELYGDQK